MYDLSTWYREGGRERERERERLRASHDARSLLNSMASVVSPSLGGPFSPPSLHDVICAPFYLLLQYCFSMFSFFSPSLLSPSPDLFAFFCRAVTRCSSEYHCRHEKKRGETLKLELSSPFPSLHFFSLALPLLSFGKVSYLSGDRFRQLSLSPLLSNERTKAIQFALQNFTPPPRPTSIGCSGDDDDDKRSISGSNLGYPAPRGEEKDREREGQRMAEGEGERCRMQRRIDDRDFYCSRPMGNLRRRRRRRD